MRSEALIEAFASVPRERFLGPGPWEIPVRPRRIGEPWTYYQTPDSDPRRLYHDVLVAIDRKRELHNGLPSFLAFKIEAARIRRSDRVVHIGCGVGYFTAIMAELAPKGEVVAVEVDAELAQRARENLKPWPNVEVIGANGTQYDPGEADVFFVNAGATHPSRVWLERLAPSGRLLLPLTTHRGHTSSRGVVLLIERDEILRARALVTISVFDCTGGRDSDSDAALAEALDRHDSDRISEVRSADHELGRGCWAHVGDICISMRMDTSEGWS